MVGSGVMAGPSSSSSWGRSDADEMAALAYGQPKKAKTGEGGAAGKAKATSVANKSLQKVNTKGMKSMMSFFGKKKE